ncbi:hypothetical protein imdm_641 [gamma proteobacterium IMCC2047]|nr:hypothetical protein imdm_641 [gamma proteobacterium IMCC2047]
MIEAPELRKRMASKGRLLAEREFAIEKITKAHLEIYRALEASQ